MAEEYANLQEFFEEPDVDEVDTEVEEEVDTESEDVVDEEVEETESPEDGSTEAEETVDEAEAEDESTDEEVDEEADDDEVGYGSDDISTLRQMLREQAQEIQTLKAQSQGLTKNLVDTGTIDESDLEPGEQESGGITDDRVQSLSLLAETMKINPNYSDFEEVCSQSNFDATVDALAKLAQQEEGGSLTEQVQNVTSYIWNLPNPYKFVYDIVKENHPKYRQPEEGQQPSEKRTVKRETPVAPGSVAKVAGGSSSKNEGWTAAKIDALDELELDKVPKAVYEKYLIGDLK